MYIEKIMLFSGATIEEAFADFMLSRKTKGLADKTFESYQNQFKSVSKHLDISVSIYQVGNIYYFFNFQW